MSKPVVKFKKFNRFETYSNGDIAVLEGVTGHNRLGDQHIVYTSVVESFEADGSKDPHVIETRNTIYVKD